MKITVLVKPNAKTQSVQTVDQNTLRVAVKAPPREGEANQAVVEAVARHFGVPKSRVHIVRGHQGKQKTLEIEGL